LYTAEGLNVDGLACVAFPHNQAAGMGREVHGRSQRETFPKAWGLATLSEPLDEVGNRARGQLAAPFLSVQLGLNLFTS